MGKTNPDHGHKYGRPDLDRIGLFGEAAYVSTGEPFVERKNDRIADTFLTYRNKGKQFVTNPPKKGHETKDVFFEKEYMRAFESEAYTDLVALRRHLRLKAKEKNITSTPFKPSSVPPKPSGSGSLFGTIEQQWPLPKREIPIKPQEAHKKPESKKNFLTKPPKKGSGYGYSNVGIGNPYEYKSDPYNSVSESAKREREMHRKKVIGNKPFVSSSANLEFFNSFAGIDGKGDDPEGIPAESKSLPAAKNISSEEKNVPFKPSSGIGYTINKYPKYDPPAGAPIPGTVEKNTPVVIVPLKLEPIFRPSGGVKSNPIRSIIEANCPLAAPQWAQTALSTRLKIEH